MEIVSRDTIFPGLTVKIKTFDNEIKSGIVEENLTLVAYDYNGITVKIVGCDTPGKVLEISQTKTEKQTFELIGEFLSNRRYEEGTYYENKASWAYPTTSTSGTVTPWEKGKFIVAKTIQAFANAWGGTVYVGVEDRTKKILGLQGDFSFLKEGKQDADGLEQEIRTTLRKFFQREHDIFEFVFVNFIKYENKDICVINVKPSTLAFVLKFESKDHYYVRVGGSSEPFPPGKFLDYWPNHLKELELQSGRKNFN